MSAASQAPTRAMTGLATSEGPVRPERAASAALSNGEHGRAAPPTLARRAASTLSNELLPRAAWTISRTGRSGLVGIGLLLAAGLFLFSTHLDVAREVGVLRSDLATAQQRARTVVVVDKGADPAAALRALPARADVPAILRQLFEQARAAQLSVDTAKYEINATKGSGVVRHQVSFPVTGPYTQIRAFLDTTLATMPAVALHELAIDRKAIGDRNVEAQIRMTIYTRSTP